MKLFLCGLAGLSRGCRRGCYEAVVVWCVESCHVLMLEGTCGYQHSIEFTAIHCIYLLKRTGDHRASSAFLWRLCLAQSIYSSTMKRAYSDNSEERTQAKLHGRFVASGAPGSSRLHLPVTSTVSGSPAPVSQAHCLNVCSLTRMPWAAPMIALWFAMTAVVQCHDGSIAVQCSIGQQSKHLLGKGN
jgi:hypothetical protein